MKGMTLTLPPQVEEAARRVQALLEEAKARGLILEYSLDDFSGEPLPGVGGLAFYRKGAPEEAVDALEEAFLDIEDALDVGVAVILVPGEREA
jgi:transcriptional regulator of met regulon